MQIQIKKGDTLSKLASQHNTSIQDILKANPQIKDPNLIFAGKKLTIPDGSTLEGTLTEEQPAPTQATVTERATTNESFPDVPATERTLPQTTPQMGSITALKSVLKDISTLAFDQGPKPTDVLEQYAKAGVPLTTPGAISGAISQDTRSRAGLIGQQFQSVMDVIAEKQRQDAEYASTVFSALPKSIIGTLTPEEFQTIKSGQMTPELQVRIQEAQAMETDTTKKDTQIVDVDGTKQLIDKQTGEIIKEFIPTATNEAQKTALQKGSDILNLVSQLAADPLLFQYVGPVAGRTPDITAGAQDFGAKVSRLKNLLTLDNLGLMKGVLSETDVKILASAATELKRTGSEDTFKEELGRIREKVVKGLQDSGAVPQTFSQLRMFGSEEMRDEVRTLFAEAGFTVDTPPEDLEAAYQLYMRSKQDELGFNGEEATSLKTSVAMPKLQTGHITGYGSPYWDKGLDVDLQKGDVVPALNSGKVVFAQTNGGFGNQVVIQTKKGNLVRLSHLDRIDVKVGDIVKQGDPVGLGGNTGSVIPGPYGDGSHLDITVQRADGTYYTPEQIAKAYNFS